MFDASQSERDDSADADFCASEDEGASEDESAEATPSQPLPPRNHPQRERRQPERYVPTDKLYNMDKPAGEERAAVNAARSEERVGHVAHAFASMDLHKTPLVDPNVRACCRLLLRAACNPLSSACNPLTCARWVCQRGSRPRPPSAPTHGPLPSHPPARRARRRARRFGRPGAAFRPRSTCTFCGAATTWALPALTMPAGRWGADRGARGECSCPPAYGVQPRPPRAAAGATTNADRCWTALLTRLAPAAPAHPARAGQGLCAQGLCAAHRQQDAWRAAAAPDARLLLAAAQGRALRRPQLQGHRQVPRRQRPAPGPGGVMRDL